MVKILTPEEVAAMNPLAGGLGYATQKALVDSHESLRAERDQWEASYHDENTAYGKLRAEFAKFMEASQDSRSERDRIYRAGQEAMREQVVQLALHMGTPEDIVNQPMEVSYWSCRYVAEKVRALPLQERPK